MKAKLHGQESQPTKQPDQLHHGNPACSGSPRQSQQLSDHSQPSSASATRLQHLGTCNKPLARSSSTSVEQTFHENSSEWKTYLVDYRYKGQTWCLEMRATSWEDARARVRCLINANVEGEVALKIPVPESWFKRVLTLINL